MCTVVRVHENVPTKSAGFPKNQIFHGRGEKTFEPRFLKNSSKRLQNSVEYEYE